MDPEHARSGSQCLHLAGGEGRAASAVGSDGSRREAAERDARSCERKALKAPTATVTKRATLPPRDVPINAASKKPQEPTEDDWAGALLPT